MLQKYIKTSTIGAWLELSEYSSIIKRYNESLGSFVDVESVKKYDNSTNSYIELLSTTSKIRWNWNITYGNGDNDWDNNSDNLTLYASNNYHDTDDDWMKTIVVFNGGFPTDINMSFMYGGYDEFSDISCFKNGKRNKNFDLSDFAEKKWHNFTIPSGTDRIEFIITESAYAVTHYFNAEFANPSGFGFKYDSSIIVE